MIPVNTLTCRKMFCFSKYSAQLFVAGFSLKAKFFFAFCLRYLSLNKFHRSNHLIFTVSQRAEHSLSLVSSMHSLSLFLNCLVCTLNSRTVCNRFSMSTFRNFISYPFSCFTFMVLEPWTWVCVCVRTKHSKKVHFFNQCFQPFILSSWAVKLRLGYLFF